MTRALITGGGRGLGLAVGRALAERGVQVVLGVRDLGRGRTSAAALAGAVDCVELDVADEASVRRARQHLGPVDVLVNNAAVHYDEGQDVLGADPRIVREAFAVNVFGAFWCIQAWAPAMRAARRGRIVNVSSEAGSLQGMGAGTPAYATSKAALNALTLVLAAELAGTGVLVNAVCPGWTATDMGGPGGRPVAAGAAGIVWAATLPDDGPTGGFFRDGRRLPW